MIFTATHFGYPISTTQTITASIMGSGTTGGLSAVKWGVAGTIMWAWVLTIPAAAAVAAGAYFLISLSHRRATKSHQPERHRSVCGPGPQWLKAAGTCEQGLSSTADRGEAMDETYLHRLSRPYRPVVALSARLPMSRAPTVALSGAGPQSRRGAAAPAPRRHRLRGLRAHAAGRRAGARDRARRARRLGVSAVRHQLATRAAGPRTGARPRARVPRAD